MFGSRIILKKGSKDEAEKPFWISYADLMTSLMVLFLVVMSVTLLAVTQKLDETTKGEKDRDNDIKTCLSHIKNTEGDGITVDEANHLINFGTRALFKFGEYLIAPETATQLRAFTRRLLDKTHEPKCRDWLKQIVVEGFTDKRGDYLLNLDLSLNRSHQVMCVLLSKPLADPNALTPHEQKEVRKLFLVGGYSSNSTKETDIDSRRIEFRLEFLARARGDSREESDDSNEELGTCQLGKVKNVRTY